MKKKTKRDKSVSRKKEKSKIVLKLKLLLPLLRGMNEKKKSELYLKKGKLWKLDLRKRFKIELLQKKKQDEKKLKRRIASRKNHSRLFKEI